MSAAYARRWWTPRLSMSPHPRLAKLIDHALEAVRA
ncbi:hypothetical protein STVIR_7647 [Streptomyces viridochromogenes Tue57]|uniref:Uncharacterized protein n=1 Tax=Streptomyces viridochromogenes Tue57 TaxID=1160705 RepID=L8P5J1_STRVR|nr:hypothetical protein STVIR_7647 [Streptomyces viridochromogenes Tue57]